MLTTLLMRLSLLNSRGAVEATPTTALLEDTRAGLCIVMAALQGCGRRSWPSRCVQTWTERSLKAGLHFSPSVATTLRL